MSRSSRFKRADDKAADDAGCPTEQELWDEGLAQADVVSLSSLYPEEKAGHAKGDGGRGVSRSEKGDGQGEGKDRKEKDQARKSSKARRLSEHSRSSKKTAEAPERSKSKTESREGYLDIPKREKGRKHRGSSPSKEKQLTVKDRVKSIEMFARPAPPNEEECEEEMVGEQEKKEEEKVTGERNEPELKDNNASNGKENTPAENVEDLKKREKHEQYDHQEIEDREKAETNESNHPKKPRRQLPKTPLKDDVISPSNQISPVIPPSSRDYDVMPPSGQDNDVTRQFEWSEAMVKQLRGQMPSDSSSFLSETVSSIAEIGQAPETSSSTKPQADIPQRSGEEDSLGRQGEGVSYLYHDPEAALRLQTRPKSNLRQGVKKTTNGLATVSQVVVDWVRRKDKPSALAQETPWLVNEKGASKADLMAKYKFFSSARLRYKARNMIGATGSRHINQRRRASIASGTTLPLTLVPNLGQLSEADENRMANVPRRRVVDTSDLRTCAILQSRLKELKTYPE